MNRRTSLKFEILFSVIFSLLIMAVWFLVVFAAEKAGLFKKHILAQITEIL